MNLQYRYSFTVFSKLVNENLGKNKETPNHLRNSSRVLLLQETQKRTTVVNWYPKNMNFQSNRLVF